MKGILGKKLGMTRVIQDDGRVIPITVVECKPNEITQIKTTEKDGYPAMVLGFMKLSKPTKTKKFRYLKEFRVEASDEVKKGEEVTVDIFEPGEEIIITGVSKGKGFQGVVRRHHFAGGPGGHGSHFKREPGSIGARAKPGKVNRGHRMAGRMGCETVTLKTAVAYLDKPKCLIGIKGAVPGSINSLVAIKKIA
jgi:large subunit ribosomal protein L3